MTLPETQEQWSSLAKHSLGPVVGNVLRLDAFYQRFGLRPSSVHPALPDLGPLLRWAL